MRFLVFYSVLLIEIPQLDSKLEEWWIRTRAQFTPADRRVVDTMITLISWRLWKQRNARVFLNIREQVRLERLVELIGEEFHLWRLARLREGGRHNISRE